MGRRESFLRRVLKCHQGCHTIATARNGKARTAANTKPSTASTASDRVAGDPSGCARTPLAVEQEDIMKKLVLLTSVLLLVVLIPWASAQEKPEAKMLQEKLNHKIAEMKASGASQSEIDAFTVEFKKKVAAMKEAQHKGTPDAKMIKEKYEKKVAQMKTSGASQEDIDAFTADFKKKVAVMNNGPVSSPPDEKAFMEQVNKKAKHMKEAGATADEINRMVTEAKQQWAEMNAKAEKEQKRIISRRIEK